ncbi:hypothetical protein B0E50_04220 [Rhodanobacter sp. C01]|nr:hypothetical protein B0E50_04220 [Rhodanobacter sp. C01]
MIAVLSIINIKRDPPPELQGSLFAHGHIVQCNFENLSRSNNSQFFLGITLDAPSAPYLRLNPNNSERGKYESLCQRKAAVHVTYQAIQRLVGPIRFWVKDIVEG